MEIRLKQKREIELPSGAVQTYPAGWTGPVDDVIAMHWIGEGAADPLSPGAVVFSNAQAAVLAAAADQILIEAAGHMAAGATAPDAGDAGEPA